MSDPRPNIFLITNGQQRWDTSHAAGNFHIFTPHLNWLADTGVRFDRAYTDCPIFITARTTITIAIPMYAHGTVSNNQTEPMRGRETIAGLFTQASYQTHAQGKLHFHPKNAKDDMLFDLSEDIGEKNSLAAKHPDLDEPLTARMKGLDAKIAKNTRKPWRK